MLLLTGASAPLVATGETPLLYIAAGYGHEAIVAALLAGGAAVDLQTNDGPYAQQGLHERDGGVLSSPYK